MAGNSVLQNGIQSSARMDGDTLEPWRSVRVFLASKACKICGELFHPKADQPEVRWNEQECCSRSCANTVPDSWRKSRANIAQKTCANCGKVFFPWKMGTKLQGEKSWSEQECCSISCSKKYKNPMFQESCRERVSLQLREMKHRPPIQGGNGRPLPEAQSMLLRALGREWKAELVVLTHMPKHLGFPYCYKIDIGNAELKIGIEVDGRSHCSLKAQARDRKKDCFLETLGWKIYRVKNPAVMKMCSTFKSPATLLTLLMES
jgi:hypothetical protein